MTCTPILAGLGPFSNCTSTSTAAPALSRYRILWDAPCPPAPLPPPLPRFNSRVRILVGARQGYALIEYKTYAEGAAAVAESEGVALLDQPISVAWAFKPKPAGYQANRGDGMGNRRGGGGYELRLALSGSVCLSVCLSLSLSLSVSLCLASCIQGGH